MRYKIGVMGASSGELNEDTLKKAYLIGEEIAKRGLILVTGATTGYPDEAAKGAKSANGFVLGISPALSKKEHEDLGMPTEHCDVIIYTGVGFHARNPINIQTADAVIFIGGGVGTLNELAVSYNHSKNIGLLKGSGGVTDEAELILKSCYTKSNSRIIAESDPVKLVEKIVGVLR